MIPSLIVLASPAPQANILQAYPNHRLITEGQIFNHLSGKPFAGTQYGLDSIEQLCGAFVAESIKSPLIIHTFNPVIQNFLMCYEPRTNSGDRLVEDLDSTRERFLLWKATNNDGLFFRALDIDAIAKKLDVLCIGEALCDSLLEAEINNYVPNPPNEPPRN
ncbi:hypothetical protein OTK49_02410 [Vibrio coralliirubri]|uniref:hypothetical protein n=1 Tax=Vibrio coralliirubri TaxID=1516159 RepID=UPI002284BDAD|nr:hypothetical protein [Vibrio coralliirubri]MCY9861369.1 hypothetical protein [Vibrio coralliirubri]